MDNTYSKKFPTDFPTTFTNGEPYQRYSNQNWISNNNNDFVDNNVKDAYNFDSQGLSVLNEPDIQYQNNVRFIAVSSMDRNLSLYPNPNYYQIQLNDNFKNISCIELIQAIIPDQNNVVLEPFLLLNISEIDTVIDTQNSAISKSFATLQSTPAVANSAFINVENNIHANTPKIFRPAKASLDKMTITITDYNGNPFNFGTDSTSLPVTKNLQNWFFFKITTMEKKRDELNFRNVY